MMNILDTRPAKKTLVAWVTLSICIVVLPHVARIHPSITTTFIILVAWKIFSLRYTWLLFSRWVIVLFAIISFSISAWHYGIPVGRDPGVSFLIILTGLKLLECRTYRDLRIVLVLGFFIAITHFLYSGGFFITIFIFAVVLLNSWLLIQSNRVDSFADKSGDLKVILNLVIQAIPVAIILFFLFPRFAGSFWLLQGNSDNATTGMSKTLSMGSFANLLESRETAFTATFADNQIPPSPTRYWRGGVLWDTDGKEWVSKSKLPYIFPASQPKDYEYSYEVRLESDKDNWLFALDLPTSLPKGSVLTADYYIFRNNAKQQSLSYKFTSSIRYRNQIIDNEQYRRGVHLPDNVITPRLLKFIEMIKTESSVNGQIDSHLYSNAILSHFANNNFVYSLRPPLLFSQTPVDEFLFDTQTGFCEHYASAFVTLVRAANIPARIVVGYLGGELNPKTNQITVRQSDAHAWAEYWHPINGWTRVDPTAAIAPERIESSINFDLSISANGSVRYMPVNLGFLQGMLQQGRWYSDWYKLQWQRWFVGFDTQRQKTLLSHIGLKNISLQSLLFLAFIISLLFLIASGLIFHIKDKNKPDDALKYYLAYCKKLEKLGLKKHPWEGPVDFLNRCNSIYPEFNEQYRKITELYLAARYGGIQTDSTTKVLRNMVKDTKLLANRE